MLLIESIIGTCTVVGYLSPSVLNCDTIANVIHQNMYRSFRHLDSIDIKYMLNVQKHAVGLYEYPKNRFLETMRHPTSAT